MKRHLRYQIYEEYLLEFPQDKELEKARNNMAYRAKLDLADEQIRQGKVIVKTMEELEAMAAE